MKKQKKQKEQQEKHKISEFEECTHLWNIVPGVSSKGIVLLQKIVDVIHDANYSDPGNKLPSFLIVGTEGKRLVARALANSLVLEDIRECPATYFENGYFSHQFFSDSLTNTAHIITDVEDIREKAEPTLWKYLKDRRCSYYSGADRNYDNIIHCNGLIVMTAKNENMVSPIIRRVTDHVVEIEPLTMDQLEAVIHQRLVFCGIEYEGEGVLKAIVDVGLGMTGLIIPFLEKCLMLMKAEMQEYLSMEVVRKADSLCSLPVPPLAPVKDDMPF